MSAEYRIQSPPPESMLDAKAKQLVRVSERRTTPTFTRIEFPGQLQADRPVMPERLLSLHGHPIFSQMDEETRWRLGLLETVNFFSVNIHGEQKLVAALSERLYRGGQFGDTPHVSRYLQHVIHDENSHTYMLAEFCNRYYGRVMPDLDHAFGKQELSRPGLDLLTFGRVYVLETFLAFVNSIAMRDDTIEPTARAVHRSHHLDETQHIALDRAVIKNLTGRMRDLGLHEEIRTVGSLMEKYANYAFSKLVNPRIYSELGLANPLPLAREIQVSPRWQMLKLSWRRQLDGFLTRHGLLVPAVY